jgi:protein arginine N-methyltransferase 1
MVEDVKPGSDIPLEGVDIIISEWMGFCLLQENMLDSVIYARDKFLKKGGLMFPDKAKIFMAAVDKKDFHVFNKGFWQNNKYGISMKCAIDSIE